MCHSRESGGLATLFVMTKRSNTSSQGHNPMVTRKLYAIRAQPGPQMFSVPHYLSQYGVVLAEVVHSFGSEVLETK